MDENKLRELVHEEVHNFFLMVNKVLSEATTMPATQEKELVSLVPEQEEKPEKPTHRPPKKTKAKDTKGPTREQLVAELGKLGGAAKVKKVLGEFNAAKVSDLSPEQYADVIEVAKSAG